MQNKWESMVVFQPGGSVLVGPGSEKITAEILSVAIYNRGTQYQCAWWDGRSRRVEWLEDFEVEPLPTGSTRATIGFSRDCAAQSAPPQIISRG